MLSQQVKGLGYIKLIGNSYIGPAVRGKINLQYSNVQYSKTFEWVNLNGTKRLKKNISSEDDIAMETTDWLHIYAERDENENFIQLCNNYPDTFTWETHPKNISLRQFVTNFKKNWEMKNTITVPVFTPVQKFPVKKKNKSYENWCKLTLLTEKPGCYITNVGKEFQSFEEELKNFVISSEFCPQLIKQEYEESQLEFQGDIPEDEDQLLVSPLQNLGDEEIVQPEHEAYQMHGQYEGQNDRDDDDVSSNYDADEFANDNLAYNWDSDRDTLLEDMSETELQSAKDWIKDKKMRMWPKNLTMRMLIPIL